MGPLFSGAVVIVLGGCLAAAIFVFAIFFLPFRRAALVGVLGSLGTGVGAIAAAVAAIPVVGIGPTLTGTGLLAYLLTLGVGALLGGLAAVLGYVRVSRGREKHAF
jgi:hypothetical protein